MNILAVGAHFDDIELGCGASLRRLKDEGHNIFLFVGTTSGFVSASTYDTMRSCDDARSEGTDAAAMLGAELICGDFETFSLDYSRRLNTIITQLTEKYKIDMVFSHWSGDPHHDHRCLAQAVMHGAKHVKRVLAYRSSCYDSDTPFCPNFYIDISDYWEFKLRLLKCFRSEFSRVGDKWLLFCETTAKQNGLKNDCDFAEGFVCIRWLS